jgi:carbon storage regulator CsrA
MRDDLRGNLILTRGRGQSVTLLFGDGDEDEIEVTVVSYTHDADGRVQVKLGFRAPEGVEIARTEMLAALDPERDRPAQ